MTSKQLRPLLRMLRENGVTEYQDGAITLRLQPGAVPVLSKERPAGFDPEMVAEPGDDSGEEHPEEERDPAFFLEGIMSANHPGRRSKGKPA